MSDLVKFTINGTDYGIMDEEAREKAEAAETAAASAVSTATAASETATAAGETATAASDAAAAAQATADSAVSSEFSGQSFASLEEFVVATNSTQIQTNRGYSFNFRDTGGWCPLGTAAWYECIMVRYLNYIGSGFDVQGTVILAYNGYAQVYVGRISGTTTFSVEWTSIKGAESMEILPRSATTLNGHFMGYSGGAAGMKSHASGDTTTQYMTQLNNSGALLQYSSTDSGGSWTYNGTYVRSDNITDFLSGQISRLQPGGGDSVTFTFDGNICMMFGKRGSYYGMYLLDYWTSGSITVFESSTSPYTITKSSYSRTVTVTNNLTGACPFGYIYVK